MKTRQIPIFVAGGVDTKTNPKLVKPGSALQLDNMYELRPGEWRTRNRMFVITQPDSATGVGTLYQSARGGPACIGASVVGSDGAASWNIGFPVATKFGSGNSVATNIWWPTNTKGAPYPMVTAALTDGPATYASGTTDIVDPDVTVTGTRRVAVAADSTVLARVVGHAMMNFTGDERAPPGEYALGFSLTRAVVKVASSAVGTMVIMQTGANALGYAAYSSANALLGTGTLASDLAASGYFDVKPIPGSNSLALAYAVNGGGVKIAKTSATAPALTSVIPIAGADATLCLGWLDDQKSTGNMYLATCGTTAGLVVRTIAAGSYTIGATDTIDATATANINNVTGHVRTSATDYVVLWDVLSSTPLGDYISAATVVAGSVSKGCFCSNVSLYSRSLTLSDGRYYVLSAVTSSAQASYLLLTTDTTITQRGSLAAAGPLSGLIACVCLSAASEGAGRRQASSLASSAVRGTTTTIPVARKRTVAVPGGTATQLRTLAYLSFAVATQLNRPRELGGPVWLPGGIPHVDDGTFITPATFPIYPEISTVTGSTGGPMTAGGTYNYRVVIRARDASGRVYRSAGSVPVSVTLAAGQGSAAIQLAAPVALRGDTSGTGDIVLELYRQGPVASGATLYNKVAESTTLGIGVMGFSDLTDDATAAKGEVAYFTGNVLENFQPPPSTLLEVNDNRVGLVSAENPTEFWVSKELKPGLGIAFNSQLKLSVTGDGAGPLTGLAAMDGRWILFKASAIYVVSGTGWDDTGAGGYNPPQAVTRTVGTVNPASIVNTPDGVMFQATTGGIWLLGRDLSVSYLGAPVESYATAETCVGAAPCPVLPTVRFVFPSGRMVEWDYNLKRWYTHRLRADRSGAASTVVACASTALGWCYQLANGDLLEEVAGRDRKSVV